MHTQFADELYYWRGPAPYHFMSGTTALLNPKQPRVITL